MAPPLLRIRRVHKRFGSRQVLAGVDLDVGAGQVVALVGQNGAGKSTLVNCIARTFPADVGTFELAGQPLAADAVGVGDQGVAVVWQDLALCDNLSAVANLFLGRERLGGVFLDEPAMLVQARALFERLHIPISRPLLPVGSLSGGQRQLVAVARAVMGDPLVVVLDEPTSALGVTETRVVERLLDDLRARGRAILLVSHRLEQVFNLADRIAVLRDGCIVADVSPLEVHPDDVVAMMSGVEADSTARRQLRRLRSLVEQLAEVKPAASLPLIVSTMTEALGVQRLCVHLLDQPPGGGEPRLRRSAAVGLAGPLLHALGSLPLGPEGGLPGLAAATGEAVMVEDTARDARWQPFRPATGVSGPRSSWSVPIVGSLGVLGTISGYADTVGRPQADQIELVSLYASHAAAAIDRDRLLAEATRRNRVLETLRGVLDTLAGPQVAQGGLAGSGLAVALLALCRGLGADAIAFHSAAGQQSDVTPSDLDEAVAATAGRRQREAAEIVLAADGPAGDQARPVQADVLAVPIATPDGRAAVTAWWADGAAISVDALGLLDDAARSLRLALERESLEAANAEAVSLRRSQRMQREFLFRLNHELRTPLTAIQGYASTLRQTDVDWDAPSQQRFLDSIASESARMGRLVGDLLDFSAIDSGDLRLVRDWCDIGLVLEAARRCVTEAPIAGFVLHGCNGLPSIWADHDRLEQVFVNLLENAVRHGAGLTAVDVSATVDTKGETVTVRVFDDGAGIELDPPEQVFVPHQRGNTDRPGAGLGLAIARGIVDAHGGTICFEPVPSGTSVLVTLPVEPAGAGDLGPLGDGDGDGGGDGDGDGPSAQHREHAAERL